MLVDVSEALVGVECALDVDACAADLLAASEGADPVQDGGDSDAEGFGGGSFVACDWGFCVALGRGGDEGEVLSDPGDPDALGELVVVDAACEAVEVPFVAAEGDEGEAVASVLGCVDVCFGGVVGGGLDDLSVHDGGLCLDEGLDDGGGGGVGDDDVDVAGGFDVAPGDAAVGEGLDVASVEGAYHLEGLISEAVEEAPVAGGVMGLGGFGHSQAIFMRVGVLSVGLGGVGLELGSIQSLGLIVAAWFLFYGVARVLRLERYGVDLHPLYALVKSTKLNALLLRVGGWRPGFWRVLGNMGVASFPGQVAFMTLLLVQNLYRFVFVPQQASPVMPLIPGVTIRFSSLPWFLAAAGVVILMHELAHGVQCVVAGVRVKSAALLLAVVTFGGAVEPDEGDMEAAPLMSKLRIFAFGSFVNLVMGVSLILFFTLWRGGLPPALGVFLNWLYFISTNLALVNMLPVYPLDGGQMLRAWLATREGWGVWVGRLATYAFLGLLVSNLVFSLARFGLIPI